MPTRAQMSKHSSESANARLVKATLRYLGGRGAILTATRVQKLFYLIERELVLDTGKRWFRLDYRYGQYGMYSPTLDKIVKGLDPKKDKLDVADIQSPRGKGRKVVMIGVRAAEVLPPTILRATERVLSEWGFLDTVALISEAKRTSPFVYAKRGENLDWTTLAEERSPEGEELSDKGKRRLAKALRQARPGRTRMVEDADELIEELLEAE